jgi:hypothetical protein
MVLHALRRLTALQAGPAASGAAGASSGADGKAEVPSAGGEAKVLSAGGETEVPSTDGEVRVPSGDGGAEVPLANGEADFPPAGEYASWPADDEAALALNGDTLVLPVLGDIDDVTAPPSAEQHHPASSPSRPHIAVGGTVALLDDQIAASSIDYKAYSALAGPLTRPQWDEPYQVGTVITWSQQLEGDLASTARAVVDTSRNGRGPYTGRDHPRWCNPPGRALGPAPKLDPGPAGIDGYLWIKDPGASGGPCHGGPPAGRDWPKYAAALAGASQQ